MNREKELCMGHTEFYLPKNIQVEISYIDFMYSLSKKDLKKNNTHTQHGNKIPAI